MATFVDPTQEQFAKMTAAPDDGPIHMLNMLRFRAEAAYEAGHDMADEALTGAQAYDLYATATAPIFSGVGGRIAYRWSPKLTLIGPAAETWDAVFIAAYPSAAAFMEMVMNPDYQRAVKHRQAAVADSRLVRLAPIEGGAAFA